MVASTLGQLSTLRVSAELIYPFAKTHAFSIPQDVGVIRPPTRRPANTNPSPDGWTGLASFRSKNSAPAGCLRVVAKEAIAIRWQELAKNDSAEREELIRATAVLWELKARKLEIGTAPSRNKP